MKRKQFSEEQIIGCSAGSPPRTDSAGKSLAGLGGTILFYDEFYDQIDPVLEKSMFGFEPMTMPTRAMALAVRGA